MKTKIFLFLAGVALVTLSFTFSQFNPTTTQGVENTIKSNESAPVGGFVADQIVK